MDYLGWQFIGGGLYLLNKVFLAVMQHHAAKEDERAFWFWKKWAWGVYILGLPPMVWFLWTQTSLIFAVIEIGGLPAMLCGFVNAFSRKNAPRWLEYLAIAAIPVGIFLSVREVGGFGTVNQLLEVAGSAGFLIGTYLIYKERLSGYGWFMTMNIATGILFWRTDRLLLSAFQAASVIFIAYAYRMRAARRTISTNNPGGSNP